METLKRLSPELLIGILAAGLFLPFLGAVHLFDWDEINFAESAREMLYTGNYTQVQVNYRPFWEKPPLFIWMQAFSMKVFGVNEFAARFPNVVCGLLTLLTVFRFGSKYFNKRFGWLWILAMIGSFTPHLYFKTGIIDPWFNLFIFLSLLMIFEASIRAGRSRRLSYVLGGIFIGLALLTKGPVSILIILISIVAMLVWKRFRFFFNIWDVLLYTLACILVSFVWYGMEIIRNGFWFIQEFIQYQQELASQSVATHGQPWYYHPIVLLLGAFPASVIAWPGFIRPANGDDHQKAFRQWMLILFWVVLILFSIVKTKIIHYSSLCYLPLTFLAAYSMEMILQVKLRLPCWYRVPVGLVGILMGLAFLGIPLVFLIPDWKASLIQATQDPFAQANLLLDSQFHWIAILPGLGLLAAVVYAVFRFKKPAHVFSSLFLGGLFGIQGFLLTSVPALEVHTQGAAIQFLEELEDRDVYVETLGYKSYAQYFYSQNLPVGDTASFQTYLVEHAPLYAGVPSRDVPGLAFRDWLIHGKIDKPAFFISKIQQRADFEKLDNLEVIGNEGGFVFYRRVNAPGSSGRP